MIIFREPSMSEPMECPYIPTEQLVYEFFHAARVTDTELGELLSSGWRKFGYYYFRPECPHCSACMPLRIRIKEFTPSRSQKKVESQGKKVTMKRMPLQFRPDLYEIYVDHSINRFGRLADQDDFIASFYKQSCPSFQTEYYLNEDIFAAGYVDLAQDGLSSVYFIFKDSHRHLSPGTLSILMEIELCRQLNLDYYYLGYYIEQNQSMSYKNRFFPHEQLDMKTGIWHRFDR